jgi:hypothetical protein
MNNSYLESIAERVYDAIYEEDDARVCREISEEACSNVPHNFFLHATAMGLSKLAEAVANTKTTIPWLLSSAGAPGWIIAVLVPLRESGSMLPQLAIGSWVRRASRRKWFYVIGAVLQAVALLGVVLSVGLMTGTAAGYCALLSVLVFSLARGFCSVASKDVIGKTVPKTRRGRVTGLASSIGGFGILLVVALLYQLQADEKPYIGVVAMGAILFLVSAMVYTRIDEEPGAKEGGANGIAHALSSLRLLLDDIPFRRFVCARALLVGTGLSAPFIVILANQRGNSDLIYFLLAQGLASLVSGPVWGRYADLSSRYVMMFSAMAAGLLGTVIVMTELFATALMGTDWFLPTCFFVLMLVHDGVRLGRKTYLVDLGEGSKRTDYVAVSNTMIGIVLLIAGGAASYAQTLGISLAIVLFSAMTFASCLFIRRLPEVQ